MKRKKNTGKRNSGKQLAKILTASLVMNPVFYVLPSATTYVHAISAPVAPLMTPFVKSPLPDIKAGVGKPLTLDLSQYFDGATNYSSSVSNLQGFSASVSGNLLILSSDRIGTATVSITGAAADLRTVTDTFDVSVIPDTMDRDNDNHIDIGEIAAYASSHSVDRTSLNQILHFITPQTSFTPNTPPKSKGTSLSVNKNESITISPDQLFDDMDNNALTIETFSLSTTGNVSSALSGNRITVTGLQHGSLNLNVSVNDGFGGKASNSYPLSVVDATYVANHAPKWNDIPGVTVTKGTYATVDLHAGFTDDDGDALQFNPVQISSSSLNLIQVEQTQGLLKIYGAAVGTSTVTASAYDGKGGSAQGSFLVSVASESPVNHAPVYAAGSLVDMMASPDNGPVTINLAEAFTDQDNDTLTYSALVGNLDMATAEVASENLTLFPTPTSHGITPVTVSANDGHSVTQASFNLTLNRVPTLINNAIPPKNINHNSSVSVNVSSRFMDGDGDKLSYSAESDLGGALALTTQLSCGNTYASIGGLPIGTNVVTIRATDTYGSIVTDTFITNVLNNDPVFTLTPQTLHLKSSQSTQVLASDYFNDADGDSMTITSVALGTSGVVLASLSSGILSLAAVGHGTTTVTVTAIDAPHGGISSGTFDVVVNDAPTGNIPFELRILKSNGSLLFNPSNDYFFDPNEDMLEYSIQVLSSDSTVVSIGEPGYEEIDYRINGLEPGEATIKVTAKDAYDGTVSDTFMVKVYDPDDYVYEEESKSALASYFLDLTSIFTTSTSLTSYTITTDGSYSDLFNSYSLISNNILLNRKESSYLSGTTTITVKRSDGEVEETKHIVFNFYNDSDSL
ncbi:hypothetical protein GC093_31655 [Paenibacillus sp. LMG 31456]|uniref:Cadherin domain-containing protein n=1 Tax=Paenibacillus foliorum TaxID=2654974 RepID=A0A972GW61_9BACL|nr:hypothetical protein [Paenibacillus foliorum]NOU97752.1 hypothetical protein [Paenibacillus foliorum]